MLSLFVKIISNSIVSFCLSVFLLHYSTPLHASHIKNKYILVRYLWRCEQRHWSRNLQQT